MTKKGDRILEINRALEKLESFKGTDLYVESKYAIDENIVFLNSIRSLPSYAKWLINRAPKVDGTQLLELTDFPIEEWDVLMHEELIKLQKKDFPGLVKPLVDKIIQYIKSKNSDVILTNLGSGGMEIDHQILERLISENYGKKVTILAVDKSSTTHKIAKANLNDLLSNINFLELESVNKKDLDEIINKSSYKLTVVLCSNDIFNLNDNFPENYFDLAYHSLFKHHLTFNLQDSLDSLLKVIAKNTFEYDGYKSYFHSIPQSIAAWNFPVFLDGTIFSLLRYKTKLEIKKLDGTISWYNKTAHYLREY